LILTTSTPASWMPKALELYNSRSFLCDF
jgi:hypothetical protein